MLLVAAIVFAFARAEEAASFAASSSSSTTTIAPSHSSAPSGRSQSAAFFSLFAPTSSPPPKPLAFRRRPSAQTANKIHELLDEIDSRLRNASILLDSHLFALQNENKSSNVSRTWSVQPRRFPPINSTRTSTKEQNASSPVRLPFANRSDLTGTSRLSSHSTFASFPGGSPQRARKCERLTERQKYLRLQNAGAMNQRFLANSPLEASRNFPRLLPVFDDPPTSAFGRAGAMFSDATVESNRPVDPNFCDEQCEEIRNKLEELLLEVDVARQPAHSDPKAAHNDGVDGDEMSDVYESAAEEGFLEPPAVAADRPKAPSGCRLERFVPIGNCTRQGQEEHYDFERLCTECQGVYMLTDDCFPAFLNAVVCDKTEKSCLFDRYTGVSQGSCHQQKLWIKVMHNRGSKDCEQWSFTHIQLPVACECFLSKNSFLDSVPHLPNQN